VIKPRFSNFDTSNLSRLMAEMVFNAGLISPVTCIVGIKSNVERWPQNRSFVSVIRVAQESFVIQLSHFTEVLVVEVTDRHQIPTALGWSEPEQYGGINVPSWHKLVTKVSVEELAELLTSAFDDLMVTYSHHEEMSENFYLLSPAGGFSDKAEELFSSLKSNLHRLETKDAGQLSSAKAHFTNPKNKDYLRITNDDWDDEIGYLPRYAALTNHRGYPLLLLKVEVQLFGEPENLRIWNGERFTKAGFLAKVICSEKTAKQSNFELLSAHVVEKIWPMALKNQQR
jgi:hypothetical protein